MAVATISPHGGAIPTVSQQAAHLVPQGLDLLPGFHQVLPGLHECVVVQSVGVPHGAPSAFEHKWPVCDIEWCSRIASARGDSLGCPTLLWVYRLIRLMQGDMILPSGPLESGPKLGRRKVAMAVGGGMCFWLCGPTGKCSPRVFVE